MRLGHIEINEADRACLAAEIAGGKAEIDSRILRDLLDEARGRLYQDDDIGPTKAKKMKEQIRDVEYAVSRVEDEVRTLRSLLDA